MYTNKTGSNLNFNLYKGGRKYSKTRRKIKRGGNWFKRSESQVEKKVNNKCEEECNKNAKLLCTRTCKEVSLDALDGATHIIDKNYIKNVIDENKSLKEKYEKMNDDYKELKHEFDMVKRVYKIPT
jgi:hypothetical protein